MGRVIPARAVILVAAAAVLAAPVACLPAGAVAQQTQAQPAARQQAQQQQAQTERVTIRADKTVAYDTKSQILNLEGNVVIRVSDVVMTAATAQVDVGRRVATLSGSVRLAQQDLVVTGDKMVVGLDDRKASVDGGVTMTVGGEPQALPVVVTCGRLELVTSKREAVATGSVTVTRGDTSARAERAVFRDADKVAVLTGSVVATRAGKETLTCATLTFHTDRELLVAQGEVEITFDVEKRD